MFFRGFFVFFFVIFAFVGKANVTQDANSYGVLDASWSSKHFSDACKERGYNKRAIDCPGGTFPCDFCGSDSKYVKSCVNDAEYIYCKEKDSEECTYCEKMSGCLISTLRSTACSDPILEDDDDGSSTSGGSTITGEDETDETSESIVEESVVEK